MHTLAQSALAYIRRYDLLRAGDRVGIAVSGGADSVALLRILLELRRELGVVLSVVHLNHKLRGRESNADEQFVRDLAAQHGLEFVFERANVKDLAKKKKLSLEAAAREARYDFFESVLERGRQNKIATAHTLDDQAETVLLKLTRGAGTRGLAGIYPKLSIQHSAVCTERNSNVPTQHRSHKLLREGDDFSCAATGRVGTRALAPEETLSVQRATDERSLQHSGLGIRPETAIVRPLLATRRQDIEAYLKALKQGWREDSTNRELRHTRNRIRHEILPRLAAQVNPRVHEALAEAAEIARGEEAFWAEQVAHWLPQLSKELPRGGISLGGKFAELSLAVQRRLLRAAAESLGLTLEFRQVQEMLALQDGGRADISANYAAIRHKGEVSVQRASPASADYEYALAVPGAVAIPECGLKLETEVVDGRQTKGKEILPHLLDPRFAGTPLVVRNWRAGDRFWPAHSKQPRKIKELLQDRHITGDEKKRWPVVASGDEVIWLRGFGVRRDYQSRDRKGVVIREVSGK